jgi:choline dehydrogenase
METFDYIVVGGGTAGCIVATRLSEDPGVSVLLLEAGGDERRPDIETPERWLELMGTDVDWGYETVVQVATGRPVPTPRGKALGGSGSTNGMTYLRGHRRDFEEWAALGAIGWDYAGVLPYFKRAEDVPDGDPRYRGRGGPLHPARESEGDWLGARWCEGSHHLGYPLADDFNGAEMSGVGPTDSLIVDGRRESTATAYLRPAMDRPSLTVQTHALARRLVIGGGRCAGVEYLRGGAVLTAAAAEEVVLCSGAIGTPHLLMISGIGPADELGAAGISALADLPGVGRNLHDHTLLAGIRYRAGRPLSRIERGGATLLAKADGGDHGPDLHLGAMDFDYHFAWQPPVPDGFSMVVGGMRPRSRGTVRLASADPDAPPLIDPRYLTEPEDVDQLITGIEIVDRIVATGVFDELGGESETTAILRRDRAGVEQAVRDSLGTYMHPVGTCRMGVDADAVVDHELRVNGVRGLRVADASVMPVIVSCNTNAACVMIGEKAADLIRGRSLPPDDARALAAESSARPV